MTTQKASWESLKPVEKANLLKGGMSYREHYNYLMDWYLKDRKAAQANGACVPEDQLKESLKDVLEALKELNQKVDGRASAPKSGRVFRGNIFKRLCA